MKDCYSVTIVGQVEGDTTKLWYHNSIPEIKAVSDARRFWLWHWHDEPAEIIVKKDEIGG